MKTGGSLASTLILWTLALAGAGCAAPAHTATPIASPVIAATPASSSAVESSPAYWPTQGWRTSTPEEQGMDSTVLASVLRSIQEQNLNIHSILIVRNGYLVLDAYFYPFAPDVRQELHSCTKSITSALAGIAIGKGYLKGVEQPVVDLFPEREIANLDARKQAMTVQDLLTMSSGLEWIFEPASNQNPATRDSTLRMYESADPAQFVLDQPMDKQPGSTYLYSNGTSHLLAAVIQQVTRKSPFVFAQENLFGPLGITDVTWPYDPEGVNFGAGALQMAARDMAKFGYLYLKEGTWDGKQIVPSDYVRASLTRHITADNGSGYGYLWWIGGYGASAQGWGGQAISVIPSRNLIVVVTSGLADKDAALGQGVAEDMAVSAVKSGVPLAPNPKAVKELNTLVEELGLPHPQAIPPLPPVAREISGKTFSLSPNPIGWQSVTFQFDDRQAAMQVVVDGNRLELAIGLDNTYRFTPDAELPLRRFVIGPVESRLKKFHWTNNSPAGLKGSWQSDKSFAVTMQVLGKADRVDLEFTFEANSAEIWMEQIFGGYADKFDAKS